MHNDPELDTKMMGTISSDFVRVADVLKETSYELRARKITPYPIFVMSMGEQPIGQVLVLAGEKNNMWHYCASLLEEFVQRKIVEDIPVFEQVYKDPDEYCCLFVVSPEFTNFLFIPYPEE